MRESNPRTLWGVTGFQNRSITTLPTFLKGDIYLSRPLCAKVDWRPTRHILLPSLCLVNGHNYLKRKTAHSHAAAFPNKGDKNVLHARRGERIWRWLHSTLLCKLSQITHTTSTLQIIRHVVLWFYGLKQGEINLRQVFNVLVILFFGYFFVRRIFVHHVRFRQER